MFGGPLKAAIGVVKGSREKRERRERERERDIYIYTSLYRIHKYVYGFQKLVHVLGYPHSK